MSEYVVFDIETDGLDATKIHVVSVRSPTGVVKSFTNYNGIRNFFMSCNRDNINLVGHNIQRFDIPVLEKVLDIKITCNLVDTLALSWYLYPEVKRHGLERWGDTLKVPKPIIGDWENLKIQDYVHRCETDVKINTLLWEKMQKKLLELYESEEKYTKLLRYLEFKMDCAREQERSKWKLDVPRAEEGLEKLLIEKGEKVERLKRAMPQVPKITKKTRPKKPYKQDGTESAVGEKWFALLRKRSLPENYIGVVEVVSGYDEPKPTSSKQIKEWLYSFGWKPETFKYVRNKETGNVKTIPQVNLERGGGICQSIKKLYVKEPRLEILDGLSVITHRASILKGFLKEVDEEGYIKAEVQGLTNTLRFKHSICVNLPGVDKAYGELIRGVLIAPSGYELCGSDMCSLEDTTKLHYIFPHDPSYVRDQMKPNFDAHLDLAVVAGKLTQEQVDAHIKEEEDHSDVRKPFKAVNYGATYGAGASTIARSAGVTKKEGQELFDIYWERNWSLREIPKHIKTKRIGDGSLWLLNPVSNLWYSLRAGKDIFSTLNQGTGVYCFDTWIGFVRVKRPQLTAQFHDEIILTIKNGSREKCTKLLKWAIQKANKKLNLNVKLDVDVQYGSKYSQIH